MAVTLDTDVIRLIGTIACRQDQKTAAVMRRVSPLFTDVATQELFSHPHLTSTSQLRSFLEPLRAPQSGRLMETVIGLSLEDRSLVASGGEACFANWPGNESDDEEEDDDDDKEDSGNEEEYETEEARLESEDQVWMQLCEVLGQLLDNGNQQDLSRDRQASFQHLAVSNTALLRLLTQHPLLSLKPTRSPNLWSPSKALLIETLVLSGNNIQASFLGKAIKAIHLRAQSQIDGHAHDDRLCGQPED